MDDNSMNYDIFIAYSLTKYSTSTEAKNQKLFSIAQKVYRKLNGHGYKCFLNSPDDPNFRYNYTPYIAKKCNLFLLIADSTILEKQKVETNTKKIWWHNELSGFMSQKEIDGKPEIAKSFVQVYTEDDSLTDTAINNLHIVFHGMNAIRTDDNLDIWIKTNCGAVIESTDNNETGSGWDDEVAQLWHDVYAPACPSESEIEFYKSFFIEKRNSSKFPPKALILGSTKPLIQLALCEHFEVTIVDASETFSKNILTTFDEKRDQITLINCDWSEMGENAKLKKIKFDIVIGDMSIGNISNKHFEKTIEAISNLLSDGGYWLGKNLFHFSKKLTREDAEENVRNFLLKSNNPKKSEIFAETVYDIAIVSCVSGSTHEDSVEWYKMDFKRLFSTAEEICEKISKDDSLDCTTVLQAYEGFELLHDKNISFYIYDIKDFVAVAQNNNIFLSDIWYGNDAYRHNFPLLVLKKSSQEILKQIPITEIEKTLSDINKFFPRNQSKNFAMEWTKHLPSQYYLVRLSKFVDMNQDPKWKETLDNIRTDIIQAVRVGLKSDLFCCINELIDDKMDTEVDYIKNIGSLDTAQRQQMKETYKLAVLLYLSSVLADNFKGKSSLYHLVIKKLFESPLYDTVCKCWNPQEAPWVTAKVCTATNDVSIPKAEEKFVIATIKSLIDSYETKRHNWDCVVGSHMDTCALCIEAILCYYNKLDNKYKNRARTIFKDIISTYIINNNIFETMILHPLGEYSLQQLAKTTKDDDEPYQKKVLGSVAFFSSLLRLINFFQVNQSELIIEDKYKFIILNNLIKFWSGFKNLNDNVFARIGDIDICTVPQILYSLSQALKSEKDTNSNNDLYK